MVFSPEGKILEVKGINTLLKNLCAQAEDLEPQLKTMMCQQLESQFGETAIIESLEQGTAIYPSHPVSVGDSWDQTFTISNNCPMILKKTSTLKKLQGDTLEIEVLSNITTPPDPKAMDAGPIQLKCELQGSGKGTLVIDKNSGWMKSSSLTLNLEGTMTTLPSDLIPEEASWPMTLIMTTTIQAKKL